MRCMTDFARGHAGMAGLDDAGELDRSAGDKSDDILRCDSFSHYACGREFTYWMRARRLHPGAAAGVPARTSPGAAGESRHRALDLQRLDPLPRAPRQHPRPLQPDRRRPPGRQPRGPRRRPRLDPALRLPLRAAERPARPPGPPRALTSLTDERPAT